MSQKLAKPAASAPVAIDASVGAMAAGPPGQVYVHCWSPIRTAFSVRGDAACYKFDVHRTSAPARVEVADANELVLSLAAAAERRDGGALADRVRAFAPSAWMWTHLVSVVAEAPRPRDVPSLLVRLDRMPALELQRRLVGYYTSWFSEQTERPVMDLALRGDKSAIRSFLRSSMPEDTRWHASLAARLDAGPERTKTDLMALTAVWHNAVFAAVAHDTMRTLRRAVRETRRDAAHGILRAFVGCEPITDATAVVIVPSVTVGEEIHEFDHAGTLFFCVPVDDHDRDRSELAALMRVLADDTRAAMVAALAHRDLTAQELADRTGVGLSTALHHLATLRRASLVSRGGRRRSYTLRREPLRRLRSLIDDLDRAGSARRGS